ncbi:MAG: hypothetical protein HZB38_12415 [Planctomycetes bacterium]|nr:hypothetical protein [Planctomycetota bacterium]
MTIRTACMAAGMTALALPAFAGGVKQLPLQNAATGARVSAIRAASYTIVNGRMVLTSDWVQLGGSSTRTTWAYAWDSFETDVTYPNLFVPVGFNGTGLPSYCSPPPNPSGAGNRWYYGAGYRNPFVGGDIAGAAAGAVCEGLGFSWYWQGDNAGGPEQCYVAVNTWEAFDADLCTDAGSTFIDGVIYDFGLLAPGAGYYYTGIDLTGSGLFHTMPADGVGGYSTVFANAFIDTDGDGIPDTLTVATMCQPMLWGCGPDENDGTAPLPDGRVGDQSYGQYDDDNPTDGAHDLALECYDYTAGLCPDPLGACIGFLVKGGTDCICAGDLNNDGLVDISDLALFLSSFGTAAPNIPSPCADINGDGLVDISDLALFLSAFGSICP